MTRPISATATNTGRWWPRFFIPLACAALCLMVVVPWIARAAGAEGGFDGVVSSIGHRYHAHATRVPLMGLASLIASRATSGGVRGVQVAEFEHFDGPADGEELNRIVQEKLGEGWSRIIRDTSRHGDEQTLIFAHPEGKRMGLFILDLDGHEMNVVQVSVDPDHLKETIGKYDHREHDGEGQNSD